MKQNMKEAIGLSLKRYNDTYMKAANDRIDNIVSQAGTDNTEIVDARIDSAGVTHTTLNNRIIAETKMNDQHLVSCSGEHITAENTMGGSITNLEVLGNTIQNEEDLADIKSVGELQEDGTYKMSILSCGKNLINNSKVEKGFYVQENNSNVISNNGFTTSNYIKIKPNTKYVLNKLISYKAFYDRNKNIIPINPTYDVNTFTTPTNASYVRISVSNANDITTYQLEEGTVATPYEPYQENKCDILLPCQLEKVGDVSDRLYYDDVEKAWCIEKNVDEVVLNGSESWGSASEGDTVNGFAMYTPFANAKSGSACISDKLKNLMWNTHQGNTDFVLIGSDTIVINLLKTKLPTQDVTGFKAWLSQNPTLVKYQLATPQKIVLPLDVQIALNSFFGTTHVYMESGEVEGTIKCKIPKSLGATVQTLNNKTDILSDRIEAIEGLKDSQNMKYETDKGYLVCKETKNGVIDDLKIEGKTIKNLLGNQAKESITLNNSMKSKLFTLLEPIKAGTEIFIRVNITAKKAPLNGLKVNTYNADGSYSYFTGTTGVYEQMFSIKPAQDISKLGFYMPQSEFDNDVSANITFKEAQVTLINVGTGYFEGLMSVGQDVDKIEVLSRKEDGNLLDVDFTKYDISNSNGVNIGYDSIEGLPTQGGFAIHSKVFLEKGSYVCKVNEVSGVNHRIRIREINNSDIIYANITNIKFDIKESKMYKISFENNGNTTTSFKLKGISLQHYNKGSIYPHQSDKKQILFYNSNGELEPIQELHEWDSIEKHSDNKWYYHKRSGKVVLNGSEDWSLPTLETGQVDTNWETETHIAFRTSGLINPKKVFWGHQQTCICNRFKVSILNNTTYTLSDEFIGQNSLGLDIKISKSKLSTQDVEGFKQWLSENNVTVVYQLAEEEIYELAPLHLDSYANETLILCNSGAISPKMEFSITSHINELVKAYGERINLLEEKVYQYIVTQNRMQLASTYSADSVTFKVDYFSLCGDEENYDEDLYNLILNNILVGKDNYNYDKMFTIILDYASWNQISWEQFDILVGLMDMQHNPPVEELPTEDGIVEEIPNEIM